MTHGGTGGLGVRGSFSLCVWLRVDPEAGVGTTRLVFGDVANRSVARNLNVKLDKSDRIHAEWGNGEAYADDDYVNLGQPEDFCFREALSIEMWLRTTPVYPDGTHPLLIGSSAADLAVERHFNTRLDHTRHFRIEWGDRSRYTSVLEKPWFLDGGWKHLAIVLVSGKACFVYVNGQLVIARHASLPLTSTRGDDIHLGGWFHGHFRDDIAEIRLYRRARRPRKSSATGGCRRRHARHC